MFLLKKIVSPFFYPLPLCMGILLLGLVLLWFTRKQNSGKVIISIGVLLLAGLSYGPIPDQLLKPLENRYGPLRNLGSQAEIRWVVVLGGGT